MYKFNKKKISYILLFLLLLFYYYFLNTYFGFYIPCIFHKITGLLCPGCGVSRMLLAMSRLDFISAFYFNPVIFCGLPFIIYMLLKQLFYYIIDNSLKITKVENILLILYLSILILYGIIRNFL